ncbi:hypothetical protein IP65_20100 [Novosphingobium sp. AAP1]|nr:hypothetical protein IP65_20100 [Novosphingobium sp. AAP1]
MWATKQIFAKISWRLRATFFPLDPLGCQTIIRIDKSLELRFHLSRFQKGKVLEIVAVDLPTLSPLGHAGIQQKYVSAFEFIDCKKRTDCTGDETETVGPGNMRPPGLQVDDYVTAVFTEREQRIYGDREVAAQR